MFGRKKAEEKPPREKKSRGNLPLLGYDVDLGEEDDGDADLERELSALVGGAGGRGQAKKTPVSQSQLNAMVADCMKDVEDEDLSDTDDPDLLAELGELEEDSGGGFNDLLSGLLNVVGEGTGHQDSHVRLIYKGPRKTSFF